MEWNMLAINEEFLSFQGEGQNVGVLQYFIRTQGCSVGCHFCDTKHSWREEDAVTKEVDIVQRVLESGAEWACITGGEPLEQDLSFLIKMLKHNGIRVQIETSGMFYDPIIENIDWVCCSPKMLFSKTEYRKEFDTQSQEMKCVVTSEEDIEFYQTKYKDFTGVKTFQPVDNKIKEITKILLDKADPEWKVMTQQHKILDVR
ncbi:7-carboxy-7-deazaguanine synthase QueE [bacterium]|nr:7-carboxy-7-deazaguanine synthase QueE [bacterium]